MKSETGRVVFVVDVQGFDINCGHVVGTPTKHETMVKFTRRGKAIPALTMLCHDTLDSAKAALLKYIEKRANSVRELEYDSEGFFVA